MRYRPKHIAEYAAMRAMGAVLGRLPYRAALGVGWVIAALSWVALRPRMREARRRLRSVFAEGAVPDERVLRRLTWRAWRNLVFSGVDALRIPYLTEGWMRRVVDASGVEALRALVQESGRAVLVVPHMGSWEVAGLATHFQGVNLFYIVRRQKNPLTDAYLNRLRTLRGMECIERDDKGLFRAVLRRLQEGKVLTILPDVRARDASLQVRFLGGTASVMKGAAFFARLAEAPILAACVLRDGWTRHRLKPLATVRPNPALDRDADVRRMTQEVFDEFDRAIREHPDQYFWFNKRWILEPFAPPSADPAPPVP